MQIDKLSKGMAQKVQLAATLVNSPKLLLLDEPFSGLDPVNQGLLEDEILEAARGGATVALIPDAGHLIQFDAPAALAAELSGWLERHR